MHSETKNDIVTFFGCIICCVSLGSSFIIPIVMRKPQCFEEETGIQSNTYDVSPMGDISFSNTDNLGWEFLDGGNVIHAWNSRDSYYFNNSNGIQFSNHYEEYWTKNVMMLGYYSGEDWNLIYRTDGLSGFNSNFTGQTDGFMNLTLWKDLSYGSYDFRLAIRYHLGVNDSDLTVIPYIKNLGISIPFDIGFGWELKDIQVANTIVNDNIRVNDTSYLLNQTLNNIYTGLSNTRFTLFDNTYRTRQILYMRWNQSLSYLLQVKNRTGQYNAPVTLFIRVGTLGVGQEKSTILNWYDAVGDYPEVKGDWEYATGTTSTTVVVNKPSGTVENDLLVAFVATDGVETFIAPAGWTGIAEVESDACSLASFYKVATSSEPSDYTFTWGTSEDAVGSILRITGADTTNPIHANTTDFESATDQPVVAPDITTSVDNCVILRAHVLDDNDEGDDYDGYPPGHVGLFAKTDVTCGQSVVYENLSGQGSAGTATWSFANAEEWVTFSIAIAPATATLPTQSNEAPTNDSTDVAVSPSLFVVCNDVNNETMRAIWRSNSTDGVTWVTFASNTSIATGTNITQTNSNFSSGSEKYWFCVNLTDDYSDTSWANETYHFSTVLSIPEIQVITPTNGSTGVSTTPTVQIKPWDNGTYAEDMTVEWWDNASMDNSGNLLGNMVEGGSVHTIEDNVVGELFSITENGYVDNISLHIQIGDDPLNAKCGIYDNSNNFLGATEEKSITSTKVWVFNYSTRPYLTKGNSYYFVAFSDSTLSTCNITYDASGGTGLFRDSDDYSDGFPDPWVPNEYDADASVKIYCNYTAEWSLQETDNDVTSGDTASWTYTNATEDSTQYWWKTVVNNSEQTNGSVDWYSFTTEAGEEVEEWNINITGYLTGGNDTLTWALDIPGYLIGGNGTLAWTIDIPGWLSGGNDTLDWSNSVIGYLLGGNTSSYATDIIGYLTGGNDTLDWDISIPGWLSGGNDTLEWSIPVTGYLTGGNETVIAVWNLSKTGYLLGGNDTLSWSNSVTGYLTGGNESVTAVWNLSKTGYLTAGNDTLSWTVDIPGWLSGGNDTLAWNIDIPGWLTGGNDTVSYSVYTTGYLLGGNESSTVVWNLSKTGWLSGGNDTLDWDISIPGWLSGGNDTLNWSNSVTGWLSGGNETAATIWNLSKTGYLLGGNDTYLSCSFTYTVKGSIVTTTPTITESIRYKWVIEDNAETEWIPIADIHNYQVMLPDNGNYKITLIAEDSTTSVSFMQIVTIKISVTDDEKEPVPIEKPKKPRVRNIFEDTGMADWFENRNIGELVLIGIIGICAFVMLFRRRPKKLLVYPTFKKKKVKKNE